jgi:hypothetical protein
VDSRRMKWTEYVACIGEMRNASKFEFKKWRDHLEDLGVNKITARSNANADYIVTKKSTPPVRYLRPQDRTTGIYYTPTEF